MGPIGWQELVILLIIVLIIFGPGKLPDIGRAVGNGIKEFRRASNDLEEGLRGDRKSSSPTSSEPTDAKSSTSPSSDKHPS